MTRLTEEFKLGQGTLEDHPWCGRSMKITTFNIIGLTEYMVTDDCWCKIAETRADTSTSHGSIIPKIPGLLGMSTTYDQWAL